MMKLSEAQQDVIGKMDDGWELGHHIGLVGWYWLQKGQLRCGGETAKVGANTAHSLYRKGLIKWDEYGISTQKATLTQLSIEQAKEMKNA